MTLGAVFNFTIGLHLVSGWTCAAVGANEVYTNPSKRYFSESGDTLHKGAARGLVRGAMFPFYTIAAVPDIFKSEYTNIKTPWK